MTLPDPIEWGPVTRTDLVRYAGASFDFNPLHHDPDFARAQGFPDVMAHGMYTAGLLATSICRWFGQGRIRAYSVRFVAPVYPGDRLTARCLSMSPGESGTTEAALVMERTGAPVLTGGASLLQGEPGS